MNKNGNSKNRTVGPIQFFLELNALSNFQNVLFFCYYLYLGAVNWLLTIEPLSFWTRVIHNLYLYPWYIYTRMKLLSFEFDYTESVWI